jgi:hypothetical protein
LAEEVVVAEVVATEVLEAEALEVVEVISLSRFLEQRQMHSEEVVEIPLVCHFSQPPWLIWEKILE